MGVSRAQLEQPATRFAELQHRDRKPDNGRRRAVPQLKLAHQGTSLGALISGALWAAVAAERMDCAVYCLPGEPRSSGVLGGILPPHS